MTKTKTEKRFYVFDRKVSPLTTFSAVNQRYWVIDRTTNLYVDEASTKAIASAIARAMNREDASCQSRSS